MKRLVAVSLFAVPMSASADVTGIFFEPPNPTSADYHYVRVESVGCTEFRIGAIVFAAERRVVLQSGYNDTGCQPTPENLQTTRYFPIGHLRDGLHRVEFVACTNPPPPVPPCQIYRTEQLFVAQIASVPATGAPAVAILAASVVGIGIACRRRRDRA